MKLKSFYKKNMQDVQELGSIFYNYDPTVEITNTPFAITHNGKTYCAYKMSLNQKHETYISQQLLDFLTAEQLIIKT